MKGLLKFFPFLEINRNLQPPVERGGGCYAKLHVQYNEMNQAIRLH